MIGGLGNGEQIFATKVVGCCAVLAWSSETARLARGQNDAQVVGVCAWMDGPVGGTEVVEVFLAMLFSGGERHARRIRLIAGFGAAGDASPMAAG